MRWPGRGGRFAQMNWIIHGCGIAIELKGQYLDKIFEDVSHGIMKIPNLPDYIFCCFFRDLFRDLDVHIAIDEVVGVDFRVGVHLGLGGVLDHLLLFEGRIKL